MADEDDRALGAFSQLESGRISDNRVNREETVLLSTYISVSRQPGSQSLGMVVDMILGGAIFKSGHIGVVTIGEDPHAVEKLGKKLRRPENARLGGPGVIGMSVQAVDEDDVDLRGFVGAVNLGEAVGFDFVWIHHLLVGSPREV